jgi:hypothetical protein
VTVFSAPAIGDTWRVSPTSYRDSSLAESSPTGVDAAVSGAFGLAILASVVSTTCARMDTDWKWLVVIPIWVVAILLAVLWFARNTQLAAVQRVGWPTLAVAVGTLSILLAADQSIPAFWQYLPSPWLLTAGAILILAASPGTRLHSRELAACIGALALGVTACDVGLVLVINGHTGLGIALIIIAIAVIRAGYALLGAQVGSVSSAFVVAGIAVLACGLIAIADDRVALGIACIICGVLVLIGALALLLPSDGVSSR